MVKSNSLINDIIKLPIYVEAVTNKILKDDCYIEDGIDLEYIIEQDLMRVIKSDIESLAIKEYLSKEKNVKLMDEEIEKTLLRIKKKLFIRSKQLTMKDQKALIK